MHQDHGPYAPPVLTLASLPLPGLFLHAGLSPQGIIKWVLDWAEGSPRACRSPSPIAGQGPGPVPRLCRGLRRARQALSQLLKRHNGRGERGLGQTTEAFGGPKSLPGLGG